MKTITLRPHAPWYTDELRDAKHKRRKAERIWRRTGLTVDLQIFKDTCRNVNKLLIQEKRLFYSNKITECGGDQKNLFKLTKHLMGMSADTILPTHRSIEHLANRFGDFFADKVEGIVAEMGKSDVVADAMSSDCLFTGDVLASFDPTTEDEVRTLITSSPSKSCNLDPIPTWLLKECVGELLPIITAIINQSLLKSIVPAYFKRANVKPLIKKAGLDKEVLKNYRPVSNLPFISKLVEKVVSVHLQRHLKDNTLYDFFQSAYHQHHSTESAYIMILLNLLIRNYVPL
ncbi:hypothetical protein HOLleu_15372 [Holothuria leucospilota]|uniref:Uncharacterized protein n=1 Tax=Holothuria leucospilota TaxID=206669 RepID=A0A9Q1C913_HOLLE|nr:hypothetical protein HOLleu_15372 [Holothuria leucospilota]